jgi:hypothetical protein
MKKLNELIVSINELVETIFENPLGKIFGFIICVALFLWYDNYDLETYSNNFVYNKSYYGAIHSKDVFDKKLGRLRFLNLKTNEQEVHTNSLVGQEHKGLYDYAQIGDTIIKVKGKGRITIKKPSGEMQDFEYNSRILPDVE